MSERAPPDGLLGLPVTACLHISPLSQVLGLIQPVTPAQLGKDKAWREHYREESQSHGCLRSECASSHMPSPQFGAPEHSSKQQPCAVWSNPVKLEIQGQSAALEEADITHIAWLAEALWEQKHLAQLAAKICCTQSINTLAWAHVAGVKVEPVSLP